MEEFDARLLMRLHRPVPRYTSYPTAPQFGPIGAGEIERAFSRAKEPLSLYVHIPFCRTMCLFCACSVILNRRPEKQAHYVDLLCREIELLAAQFPTRRKVAELHFGGGTPTMLTEAEWTQIIDAMRAAFSLEGELSIEIDPRTVYADGGAKLRFLRALGFSRASLGVQDLDPVVQEAVRRRQTEEMTTQTLQLARAAGFSGVNFDMIYGLPYQTRARFVRTAEKVAELRPDRIAFYSYAKVPWLKEHQKALPEEAEPPAEEKLQIYLDARRIFLAAGYVPIGMDHFALPTDPIATQTLMRNFQGYSIKRSEDLIGLGVTAVSYVGQTYLQNVKTIEEYEKALAARRLPTYRGLSLSADDLRRRWTIQTLMCHFALDKTEFDGDFDTYFLDARPKLEWLKAEGLLEETPRALLPTPLGRLFIRLIASAFDAYLTAEQTQFSKSI